MAHPVQGAPSDSVDGRLVGRGAELAHLDRWLDEARQGTPRFIVLKGEPGMGTTRLAEEVQGHARKGGLRVLIGRCFEDVAVPYLPMVTALRPLITSDSASALEPLFGHGAPTAEGDANDLALYIGVADTLLDASNDVPLLLTLDALQWADRATLDLLAHVVTAVAQAANDGAVPACILLTVGDADVGAAASRTIRRIAREPGARSLELRGLDAVEVHDLLLDLAPVRPSRRLTLEVMEATGGNPLLIRELLSNLVTTGAAIDRGGELVLTRGTLPVVALDVDAAAERRLDALSPEARDFLLIGAFLGDGCALGDMKTVARLDNDAVADLIDEAEAAGCLRDDGDDRLHFAKTRLREVLFRQPPRRQRQLLHRRIADALDGRDTEGGAMAVAHHLLRAGPIADSDLIIDRCARAGDEAFALGVWALATWYYDEAAKAAEATEQAGASSSPPTVELHLRAGEAAQHDVDATAAEPHLSRALELARSAGDLPRWARALFAQMRLRVTTRGVGADPTSLQEFLDAAGERAPDLRAEALAVLAEYQFTTSDPELGVGTAERSLELASAVGDERLVAYVWFALGLQYLRRVAPAQAEESFKRGLAHAEAAGSTRYMIWNTGRIPVSQWQLGDLSAAVEASEKARALATAHQYWAEHSFACSIGAGLAVAQGRFRDAERLAESGLQTLRRTEFTSTPPLLFGALAACRAWRGNQAGAHEALKTWESAFGGRPGRFAVLVDAVVGDRRTVEAQLASTPWRDAAGQGTDLFRLPALAAQVEIADAVADTRLLATAVAGLEHAVGQGVMWTTIWPALLPRLLGVAYIGLGENHIARDWLELAADRARAGGSTPEAARVDFERARLAAIDGNRELALAMLVTAATTFDELGLLPFLSRARGLAEQLGESSAGSGSTVGTRRTVLYSDLVESTSMNVRAGDRRYLELLREHDRIVRERLRDLNGVEFKHTGDGIAAWFLSTQDAVTCAHAIAEALEEVNVLHPALPLQLRFGLASGSPLEEGQDLFGLTVVEAARLCALAEPGQVLVTEEVTSLDSRHSYRSLGRKALKGFPNPIAVFEALPAERRGAEGS